MENNNQSNGYSVCWYIRINSLLVKRKRTSSPFTAIKRLPRQKTKQDVLNVLRKELGNNLYYKHFSNIVIISSKTIYGR